MGSAENSGQRSVKMAVVNFLLSVNFRYFQSKCTFLLEFQELCTCWLPCSRSITKIIICFDSLFVCLIYEKFFLISKICPFDFGDDFLISKICSFDF